MSKVRGNPGEGDILAVLRELEKKEPAAEAQAPPQENKPDPVALRRKLEDRLRFVCIVEKTNLAHLLEGEFGGKTLCEMKEDLSTALADLDSIIKNLKD